MNRRERRKLERQFGLLKKYQKASESEKKEIRERRKKVGKRLHEQNLEKQENDRRKAEDERQLKKGDIKLDGVLQTFSSKTKNRPY